MPLLSGTASGQWLREVVYQKNGIYRAYVVPANPQTEAQQSWRNRFGDVLRELVVSGGEFRNMLYDVLGYRWHAWIIRLCLRDAAGYWIERAGVYQSFGQAEKDAWASYDGLGDLVNPAGEVFFVVASAVWRLCRDAGSSPGYSEPSAGNSAEVAAVWPR
jgi:hypothetical protein